MFYQELVMQVHKEDAYSNFVNSIDSEKTKEVYQYSLNRFLQHFQTDLDSFLSLSQQEISDLIINYLINKKISRQYKHCPLDPGVRLPK